MKSAQYGHPTILQRAAPVNNLHSTREFAFSGYFYLMCIHHDCLKHRHHTVVQVLTLVNGFFCSGFPPCCKKQKGLKHIHHDLKGSVSQI